jgi:hypothetical protein
MVFTILPPTFDHNNRNIHRVTYRGSSYADNDLTTPIYGQIHGDVSPWKEMQDMVTSTETSSASLLED